MQNVSNKKRPRKLPFLRLYKVKAAYAEQATVKTQQLDLKHRSIDQFAL